MIQVHKRQTKATLWFNGIAALSYCRPFIMPVQLRFSNFFMRIFMTFEHIIIFTWNLVFLCKPIGYHIQTFKIANKNININFWPSYWDFVGRLFFMMHSVDTTLGLYRPNKRSKDKSRKTVLYTILGYCRQCLTIDWLNDAWAAFYFVWELRPLNMKLLKYFSHIGC